MNHWQEAQKFEKDWHGKCINTFGEEEKQIVYANLMGLKMHHNGKSPYNFDIEGKNILDIGGGPVSLLLKCENKGSCFVADPCDYPTWVLHRYWFGKINTLMVKGEDLMKHFSKNIFDEVWIYNVLQHTENPEKVISNARKLSKIIRIFEWVNTGTSEGHIHDLTVENLDKWLEGHGKVEILNRPTLRGKCYYGIFKGDNFKNV